MKTLKPSPELASGFFRYVPLHKIRYGILKRRKLFTFASHSDLDRIFGVAYLTPREQAASNAAIAILEAADAKALAPAKIAAAIIVLMGGLASAVALGEGAVAALRHVHVLH